MIARLMFCIQFYKGSSHVQYLTLIVQYVLSQYLQQDGWKEQHLPNPFTKGSNFINKTINHSSIFIVR